jgi:lysozyme
VRRWAYNDPSGHATFGVGHLIHLGNVTAADKERWGTPEKPQSMARVKSVLRDDVVKFEHGVRKAVNVPLKPHELDALVSLAFNIGLGAFADSTVVRELNKGRRGRAGAAFLLWSRSGSNRTMLLPRRRRERKLFRKGKYE